MSAFLAISLLIATTEPLRNPFWPVGYEGVRESISAEPRVVIRSAPEHDAAADDNERGFRKAESVDTAHRESQLWIAARKSIRVGGIMRVKDENGTERQAISLNGNIYSDGDVISANHNHYRFTWRVHGLTDGGTLRLIRLRYREIEEEIEEKGTKK